MSRRASNFREMTQAVSAALAAVKSSIRQTKELRALALGVAARCEPCIGFHAQALVKLGATWQEIGETLGVTTYMGGGPSLMYAAAAFAAFDEFSCAL